MNDNLKLLLTINSTLYTSRYDTILNMFYYGEIHIGIQQNNYHVQGLVFMGPKRDQNSTVSETQSKADSMNYGDNLKLN